MFRGLVLAAAVLATLCGARAAQLEGVSMPDRQVVGGTEVWLNGIGLRTFSVLGIRVYVAGLYLEQRNGDPDTILGSKERKLLDIRFLRDVDAAAAQDAWRDGLAQNCKSPCYLDPQDVERFLAAVPSMRKGDRSTLLFSSKGVDITLNGRLMGEIADPHFAKMMLATFIGPEPPTRRLKRELLGLRD